MKIKTINQLITVFKDAANRHYQINGFGIGDNWEVGASKANMHPVLWINPVSAIMAESENNIGYKTFEIDFEIRVFDLVNKDESNENEVLSDTIDILKDIITEFKGHPYYTNSQLNIVNDINFEPFTEEFDEEVSGWVCELSLKSPLVSSWCGLPMAEIEGFSFPGNDCEGYNAVCDVTYVDDVVGVYPIEVTTASGNTKIISIDNAFLTGLTITDGNATTANGTSVDLGGEMTSDVIIDGLSGTSSMYIGSYGPDQQVGTFAVGARDGIQLFDYENNQISSSLSLGSGTAYMSSNFNGGNTSINGGNTYVSSFDNKKFQLNITSGGIAPGSGESFIINGVTFTEGIDFIGQGDAILDAATIAGLDYSSVPDFISVDYTAGDDYVTFNFSTPATVSISITNGSLSEYLFTNQLALLPNGLFLTSGNNGLFINQNSEHKFIDNTASPKGIQYGANYDATLVDDSLIPKRYVDNAISAITDNNYYTTGATLIGNIVYFDRNDTLSAYTADLSSLSISLTDGNATTANGSSVDLGGSFTQTTTTLLGSNTETFNIGANVSGGNIDTTNINSSNLNIRNLTSYDGTGVGTNINLSSIGLFIDNDFDSNSKTFLGSFVGSSTIQYNDNRLLKLLIPNGGIGNGSGESFIVNGITFTEGIDFTGQNDKSLDVATLLALDYSSVPNFVRVTYDGSSLFYEFIQNATLTTNITNAIITNKQYNEQVSVNNQGVIIQDNGTELVLSNKNDKHYFKDDTLIPKGLQYDSDYSANYAPLSLITYKDLTGYTTDNFYTTGSTIIGNTIYFNRNDTLSAYTVDLSSVIPTDTNFANTNLTLNASRTHQLNGFDLTIASGPNITTTDRALVINSFKDVFTRGKGDQNNLVFGFNTGRSITSAANNVILGDLAGQNMTTAQNTVLIGRSAGAAITTTANQTVAIGRGALENITVSSDNTAVGYNALNAQTSSQFNTAVGSLAGSTNVSGGSNVFIGRNAQPLNPTDNSSIVIGANAVGLGGGTAVIGSSSITRTGLRGRVEMDTTTDGLLIPRLTTAQMNAVASPVTNTILYNTDLNGLYRYNGSAWVPLSVGYGIVGVYSSTDTTGRPTFFATLQSALETCKASGGYFTVKLYSNLTITSAIEIDYANSGVGNAYLFRQLTIDFNGFSITNAQANTSDAFTVELSNSASVYQEIRFINGTVLRTNGTGTHHALKCDTINRFGTVQMSNMLWYCQNNQAARINLGLSTAVDASTVMDLGGSKFISGGTGRTCTFNNAAQTITNFSVRSTSSLDAFYPDGGRYYNFYAENTSSGAAILAVGSNAILTNFNCRSNSGKALDLNGTGMEAHNFIAKSTSGIAVDVKGAATATLFKCDTGNAVALNIEGNSTVKHAYAQNNSGSVGAVATNDANIVEDVTGVNLGASFGGRLQNTTALRGTYNYCTFRSIGGIGAEIISTTNTIDLDSCNFESQLDTSSGHALRVQSVTAGTFLLTKCDFKVRNSGANCLNAAAATTVRSRYSTHNDVASTPINANVTIVSSGIIS